MALILKKVITSESNKRVGIFKSCERKKKKKKKKNDYFK